MRSTVLGVLLAITAAGIARAQVADQQLVFEVASIKPAAPKTAADMRITSRAGGGPGSSDPGRVIYSNVSLKNLLVNAFGVKAYQISGPGWLDSERFDVVAKVPQGATKEQIRIMMRNLLKERFMLAVHHETKDLPMYALVVGKNGPKMKESLPDPPPPAATEAPGDGAPKPPDPAAMATALGKVAIGPDGTVTLPPGFGPKTGCFTFMMAGPNGLKTHMQCSKQTMAAFAELLSNQVDRPVNDMTGLAAKYDFNLDFAPDENRMVTMLSPGGASATFSHEVSSAPMSGPKSEAPETASAPPLPAAVQEQLGLKLEQKKGPVDLIVIDRMEKAPTEN